MHAFRLFIIPISTALLLLGCRKDVSSVDELIERNTKAMGGRAAIEAVQGVKINLHIVDPGFEVDGIYRAIRPGRMRIDVQHEGRTVFTEAFDGTNGWEMHDEGEREAASEKGTAALRHGVNLPGKLFGLHEMKSRGHRVEFAGRQKIEAVDYYVLRVTMSDGYTSSLFLDPTSWLITRRRDVRPLHVDVDPTPTTIETQMSDFREVAGVKFPFAQKEIDLQTGKELERVKVNEIKVNPEIDASIFEKT